MSDIAEAADVGRSTFYAHYTDKDDLLRGGMGFLRENLVREHRKVADKEESLDRRIFGFTRFMTAHLKEEQKLYQAIIKGRAGPIVRGKLQQFLREIIQAELAEAEFPSHRPATPEMVVEFTVGAYMSLVTWWMDRGAKEPPEEIDRVFHELASGGISGLLQH